MVGNVWKRFVLTESGSIESGKSRLSKQCPDILQTSCSSSGSIMTSLHVSSHTRKKICDSSITRVLKPLENPKQNFNIKEKGISYHEQVQFFHIQMHLQFGNMYKFLQSKCDLWLSCQPSPCYFSMKILDQPQSCQELFGHPAPANAQLFCFFFFSLPEK